MRRLKGAAPRVFASHAGAAGRLYGQFYRALAVRFPVGVPVDVVPLLRDCAAVNVDIVNLTRDVEAARKRHRRTEERRLRRSLNGARRTLRIYLAQIDQKVAANQPSEWGELLRRTETR